MLPPHRGIASKKDAGLVSIGTRSHSVVKAATSRANTSRLDRLLAALPVLVQTIYAASLHLIAFESEAFNTCVSFGNYIYENEKRCRGLGFKSPKLGVNIASFLFCTLGNDRNGKTEHRY